MEDLKAGGFWKRGPDFLCTPVEEWPVKSTFKKEGLDGEIVREKVFAVQAVVQYEVDDYPKSLLNRSSSWKRMLRVLAWMVKAPKLNVEKSLEYIEFSFARTVMVKLVLKELVGELKVASEKGTGRFRKLAPVQDDDGLWRVQE